jgi:hypothetical protein
MMSTLIRCGSRRWHNLQKGEGGMSSHGSGRLSHDQGAGMRIIVGVLQIIVALLAAVVGASFCYFELFSERPDWVTVIIGVVMLLVGVGGIWAGINRAIRG